MSNNRGGMTISRSSSFLVVDSDAILAMDRFYSTAAVLDSKNKRVIFPPKEAGEPPKEEEENEILLTEVVKITEEISSGEDWPIVESNQNGAVQDNPEYELPDGAINPSLIRVDIKQVESFQKKVFNMRIFASTIRELEECTLLLYQLHLTDYKPIYTPPYRKSEKERLIERKEVEEMLKWGIIRVITSPWSSPNILIPKPDGTFRLCTDFRRVNA